MKRVACFFTAMLFVLTCLTGCGTYNAPDTVDVSMHSRVTPSAALQSQTPAITPTEYEQPTPTVSDTPISETHATFGFVGDIMAMNVQIKNAINKTTGEYNFTRSFEPMRELFNSVDIMCGNLEMPLAGENAGYSLPAPTQTPKTPENPNPPRVFQSFNAPDALANNLRELGFDMLTTSNNHCLDRGIEGLRRTLGILDDAGLYHTGTYVSKDDAPPLIISVNGISVGFVAFAGGFNTQERGLSDDDKACISYMYDTAYVKSRIALTREAGAEYIIAMPHCGDEYQTEVSEKFQKLYRNLISWGADAIIASHPHVVQKIEWVDAERNGKSIHAPIVYSLGNFIANMSPAPKDYELFVRLTVMKDASGVKATELSYLPVYCLKQYTSDGLIHQTLPCYADMSEITAYKPLTDKDRENIKKCREHVIAVCSDKFLMDK